MAVHTAEPPLLARILVPRPHGLAVHASLPVPIDGAVAPRAELGRVRVANGRAIVEDEQVAVLLEVTVEAASVHAVVHHDGGVLLHLARSHVQRLEQLMAIRALLVDSTDVHHRRIGQRSAERVSTDLITRHLDPLPDIAFHRGGVRRCHEPDREGDPEKEEGKSQGTRCVGSAAMSGGEGCYGYRAVLVWTGRGKRGNECDVRTIALGRTHKCVALYP